MSNKSLMGIFAHADDIEFAIGGTCLKYVKKGYKVDYIMSTNNMSGQIHQVGKDGSITLIPCPPQEMEPIRVYQKFPAVKKWKTKNGWAFDVGQNLAGYGEYVLRGKAGTEMGHPQSLIKHNPPVFFRENRRILLHSQERKLT